MSTDIIVDLMHEAVGVTIKLGAPMLVLSMAVGVIVALFQAVTQIHEQTIGFVLKLVVIVGVLMLGGGWMLTTLQDYLKQIFMTFAL